MRVGLLIYGDIDTLSGGYLYDRKLVDFLSRQGDTVEVISLADKGYWRSMLDAGVQDALRDRRLDVLIQDELVHPALLLANDWIRDTLSCPVVTLVHLLKSSIPNPSYKRALFRRVEKRYLSTTDGMILNSRDTLAKTRTLMAGAMPPHTVALPCGDNFSPAEAAAEGESRTELDSLRLLYVGAVTRQKGLHVLLEALDRAGDRRMKLTITGRQDMEPAYVEEIGRLIHTLGLQDQTRFTGPLTSSELVKAYKSHDVLVLPSVNESYGIVYLEAQQFGLPVIGTSHGGAKEIIEHGKSGYLIEPGDVDGLAGILNRLRGNPLLLEALGRNAAENYRRHPVWDDTGRTIREFLIQVRKHCD